MVDGKIEFNQKTFNENTQIMYSENKNEFIIEKIYNTKMTEVINGENLDLVNKYNLEINRLFDLLKKNVNQLKYDYDIFYHKQNINNKKIIDGYKITDDNYISLVKNSVKDAKNTDKLIYIVVIFYIILLLGTNKII